MLAFESFTIGETKLFTLSYSYLEEEKYESVLTIFERQRIKSFRSETRRQEFLAARLIKNRFLGEGEISYDKIGAPFLPQAGYISISHSSGLAGIIRNNDFRVGLDIERISDKACRVSRRFVSAEEREKWNVNSPLEMSTLWSLKEVLYKLSQERGLLFSKQLLVKKQGDNSFEGRIILNQTEVRCKMATFVTDKHILSCNVSCCEIQVKPSSKYFIPSKGNSHPD
jgi:4'-phosphopantetheinyl transferase EntD